MCDALQVVALPVGEVVHRVGVPFVAGANVWDVHHAVEKWVAEEHIRVGHIDFGTQDKRSGHSLAAVHEAEEAEAFLGRTVAEGAVGARLRGRTLLLGDDFGALLVHIGAALQDEPLGKIPKLLEVVAGVVHIVPLEPKPLYVVLNALDVLGVLLDGVRVVEAQVALAAILLGDAEVEGNGFGVSDVQVAVGFGREACLYASAVEAFCQVFLYFLLYEVEASLLLCIGADCLCHCVI